MESSLYDALVSGNYEIEITDEEGKEERGCYLALASALKRDLSSAGHHIPFAQELLLPDIDRSVCLEAKAVAAYFRGNPSNAENYAWQALELNQRAFFARSILARLATWRRDFALASEQYHNLLEFYPQHSSVLLDLAETLVAAKGDYREILECVKRAKGGFRRNMYLFLIPFGKPMIRLLLAFTAFMLFSIPKIGIFIFGFTSLLFLSMGIATILKIKLDTLILSRLFLLQVVAILVWILTQLF